MSVSPYLETSMTACFFMSQSSDYHVTLVTDILKLSFILRYPFFKGSKYTISMGQHQVSFIERCPSFLCFTATKQPVFPPSIK